MSTKLYIGGLAWATTDQDLQSAFSQAGNVVSARVMTDRMSGRSRGFGFVEMETEEAAQNAIEMFNGKDLGGRMIQVNIARPMEERAPRQGGYDRGPRDFNHSRGGSNFGNRGGGGSGFGNRGGSGGGRSFGGGGGRGRGGSGFRSGSR